MRRIRGALARRRHSRSGIDGTSSPASEKATTAAPPATNAGAGPTRSTARPNSGGATASEERAAEVVDDGAPEQEKQDLRPGKACADEAELNGAAAERQDLERQGHEVDEGPEHRHRLDDPHEAEVTVTQRLEGPVSRIQRGGRWAIVSGSDATSGICTVGATAPIGSACRLT